MGSVLDSHFLEAAGKPASLEPNSFLGKPRTENPADTAEPRAERLSEPESRGRPKPREKESSSSREAPQKQKPGS